MRPVNVVKGKQGFQPTMSGAAVPRLQPTPINQMSPPRGQSIWSRVSSVFRGQPKPVDMPSPTLPRQSKPSNGPRGPQPPRANPVEPTPSPVGDPQRPWLDANPIELQEMASGKGHSAEFFNFVYQHGNLGAVRAMAGNTEAPRAILADIASRPRSYNETLGGQSWLNPAAVAQHTLSLIDNKH